MKKNKLVYWISTGLLSALVLMSAGMYIFDYENVTKTFLGLGFPAFVVYPLAIAKILGVLAIWTNISKTLKEWAYAGYFFNFTLAFFAHIMVSDGDFPGALMALVLLALSYFSWKKIASSEA